MADFRKGDFNARLPVDSTGIAGKVYDAINEIIDLNSRLTRELGRISEVVGKEGKIRYRASLPGATGGWADCVDSVNSLVGDLIQPMAAGQLQRAAIVAELADLASDRHAGRTDAQQITVFKSVGIAAEDIAAARLVYEAAGNRDQ